MVYTRDFTIYGKEYKNDWIARQIETWLNAIERHVDTDDIRKKDGKYYVKAESCIRSNFSNVLTYWSNYIVITDEMKDDIKILGEHLDTMTAKDFQKLYHLIMDGYKDITFAEEV